MDRARFSRSLCAAVALFALCLPASALAGSYTWNLASDFTSTPPGANPDHDQFGATPWSYVESQTGAAPSHDPATFRKLSSFSTGIDGGLAGWSDPADPAALVAVNPSGSTITSGEDQFPAGQVVASPPTDRFVAIGWKSPLSQTASVQVTVATSPDDPSSLCLGRSAWTLDLNGAIQRAGLTAGGFVATTLTVAPGQTIYVTVSPGASQVTDPACGATEVAMLIKASAPSAPRVTLTSPAPGAIVSGTQPTFSGSADTRFGTSSTVAVRVYSGSVASGTPVETLQATRVGGGYSIPATPSLADGQYTARAEQDDLSSPADTGFSAPVTFTLRNAPPPVKLNSLTSKPLRTATPTLTGTAGIKPGDSRTVTVLVYPGASTSAPAVRTLTTSVHSDGSYSVSIKPPLPDGQYTALAEQSAAGAVGSSLPQTFHIKLHAPVVSLQQPAAGARTNAATPEFSGTAGTIYGDSSLITVLLYRGRSATGTPLGTLRVRANGSQWSGQWTHPLRTGVYTARAKQGDDAGHTGYSAAHTFLIVPGRGPIGASVTVDPSGTAKAAVRCTGPVGSVCSGTVLVLSVRTFRPVPGGPAGQVRVLFAYVTIPGGRTQTVSGQLDPATARFLRRNAPLGVDVTTQFSVGGAQPQTFSSVRELRAT